jgi:hypothetical protein
VVAESIPGFHCANGHAMMVPTRIPADDRNKLRRQSTNSSHAGDCRKAARTVDDRNLPFAAGDRISYKAEILR